VPRCFSSENRNLRTSREGPAALKLAGILAISAAGLSGCGHWQRRAGTLQSGICGLVSSGHGTKDDFILRFGAPTTCAARAAGEACQWNSEAGSSSDEIRVEFDGAGRFVSGSAQVRHGSRIFRDAELGERCQGLKARYPAGEPMAADVQVLYARMAQMYSVDKQSAAALWRRQSFTGRGALESYIIAAKGKGGTLSWKFHVDQSLPAAEQDFVRWFLRSFTSYQPAKD
jgi:hypothetical protein